MTATPPRCPDCGASARLSRGICLGCLLGSGLERANESPEEDFASLLDSVAAPDTLWRLGQYQILEEIGRGGMGVIYRARQRHSRRIVALKRVLSYHTESRETLSRFRREAEAASSLDHPNILPIYEVGESEEGVPYFSMKYASGGTLQEIGPALRDQPRQIVRLLAKVTRAVQHAHRQGILHRDLKPGNILLDGRGEPLVSDFGLAKWLDASTDLTRTLTIFGTPGYIAPEQAEGPAANLKPAADIYSLGAILFDLLTGRPPFLGEHALAVIRQAAETPAPKLRSLVKGADKDLETICARCLERDPEARYRSAGELAEDLERWLEGRSILARPVSPPAHLLRWSRRNPALAGAAAMLAVLLMLLEGGYLWHRRSQAAANAEIAKLREGVMQFAQTEAEVCQPGDPNRQEEVYLALANQLGVNVALLRGKLPPFAVYLKSAAGASDYERANAAYVAKDYLAAEQLALRAASKARSATPPKTGAIIESLELAGLSAEAAIKYPRAMQHFREAEGFASAHRDSEQWARLQDAIADLLFAEGKYAEAEKLLRTVIEIRSKALGPEHPDTLMSRNRLIYILNEAEKHDQAEAEAREVLALREKVLGLEHPDTLLSRYNLASALYHKGQFGQAERLYRAVLEADERVLGSQHPRTLAASIGLANTLNDQKSYEEAIGTYRRVIQADQTVYGPEHPITLNDRMDLATALQANHQYRAAEIEYRSVIQLQKKVIGPEHAYTLNTRNNFAELLDDERKYAEAEVECRQAIALEQKVVGPAHRLTLNTRGNLAVALIGQGKIEQGRNEIAETTRLMSEQLGWGYPDTIAFTTRFANVLAGHGRTDLAIEVAQRAQEGASSALGSDHAATRQYRDLLQSLKKAK